MPDAAPPSGERRRSPRLWQRLPVHLEGEGKAGHVKEAGEAVGLSAHGALLKVSSELRAGSEVEIENPRTGQRARFRVIWATEKPLEGKWDIGVELKAGQALPWGTDYSE